MHLTRYTDYSLRVLIYLAVHQEELQHALADYHLQHIPRGGTERHAQADLSRPPHDDLRHQSEDPDRGQQHREAREQREQHRLEPADRERFADLRVDRADPRDRPGRIERTDLLAHRRHERQGRRIGDDEELHVSSDGQCRRSEDLEPRAAVQPAAPHVADDAHDRLHGRLGAGVPKITRLPVGS